MKKIVLFLMLALLCTSNVFAAVISNANTVQAQAIVDQATIKGQVIPSSMNYCVPSDYVTCPFSGDFKLWAKCVFPSNTRAECKRFADKIGGYKDCKQYVGSPKLAIDCMAKVDEAKKAKAIAAAK